MNKQISS